MQQKEERDLVYTDVQDITKSKASWNDDGKDVILLLVESFELV